MKKKMEIQIKYDENGCYKLTKLKNGEILCEGISSEEAALWEAEHRF
jgi:hypothetical protein